MRHSHACRRHGAGRQAHGRDQCSDAHWEGVDPDLLAKNIRYVEAVTTISTVSLSTSTRFERSRHPRQSGRHRFEADLGDGSFAFAEYLLLKGRIIFTHTEVPPEHEGRASARRLSATRLKRRGKRGLLVIPKCPFFAAYMQKHEEVQDLLDPAWRTKLGVE